jgi:hypothetical protein
VGDSLGGVAICFLVVPLLGIALGIAGGLLSRGAGAAASFSHLAGPQPAVTAPIGRVTTLSTDAVVDASQQSSADTHAGTLAVFSAILLIAFIAALQLRI